MRNNWLFYMDSDGGSSQIFPLDPLLYNITSFVDNSRYFYVPGSLALQEAFNCVSKVAGAVFFWFASGSNSNVRGNLPRNGDGPNPSSFKSSTQVKHITSARQSVRGLFCHSGSRGKSTIPVLFAKVSRFAMKQLSKEGGRLQSIPSLSLAAALVPPLDNLSRNVLAVPVEIGAVEAQRCMDQRPCEVHNNRCCDLSFQPLNWSKQTVEPRTGIEFPTILDNEVAAENKSTFMSEVLVGTGSRIMTVIRIKSLKVYAFGFYVHPFDICEKLGPKYASIPVYELNKRRDFYEDLLRADINMTVRLVVSCNGIKINTVRDAFEKSLRARLVKTNPDADHSCLQAFGSMFSQDIPLHAGTTINFRRTADGHLITEVGSNQLGTVYSKDLCRAFFDMYIGDIPVCEQTKEEIGKNVASIIGRC